MRTLGFASPSIPNFLGMALSITYEPATVQKDYIFPFQFPFIGRVISKIGMGAVTWNLQYNLRKYAFTTESKSITNIDFLNSVGM